MLLRLGEEASKRRLASATGNDLLDYIDSEFLQSPDVADTFAEGTITLGRADATLAMPGGDYPKGTRIARSQYTAAGILFPSAEYETLADAHVEPGSTAHIQIPIRAVTTGVDSNAPMVIGVDATKNIGIPNRIGNMKVIAFDPMPDAAFCTDNGAMIALAGALRLAAGQVETTAIKVRPRWDLASLPPVA